MTAPPGRDDRRNDPRPYGETGRPGAPATFELHPVEDSARRVLTALREILMLGEVVRPGHLPGGIAELPAPESFLRLADESSELVAEAERAGEALLRRLLGREGAPSAEELEAVAKRLEASTDRAFDTLGIAKDLATATDRKRAVEAAARLLHEIGLERLDVEVETGHGKESDVIGARSVDPTTAHVLLLGRLFERVELLSTSDELLALERVASAWWFHTHSAPADPDTAFGQKIRESEWSLVERDTLTFDGPLLEVFLDLSTLDDGLNDGLPPRQRALARALLASFAGAFVVRERSGTSAVYEEVLRGRRFEVHEHSDDIGYGPGWMGFGRILAFDGPLHLRSPGMFFAPPEKGLRDIVDQTLQEGRPTLSAPLLVELLYSIFQGQRDLPRPLPPAESPRAARELAAGLFNALAERGLAQEPPADRNEPEILRRGPPSGRKTIDRRLEVDDAVGDWMRALVEYGERKGRTRTKGNKRKKGKKGGR